MGKLLTGILLGLVIGGITTYLALVGVPRSGQLPGRPIGLPGTDPEPGAAQLVLKQDLFNDILRTIFRDMQPPALELTGSSRPDPTVPAAQLASTNSNSSCDGKIRVLPEGSGVVTGVKFENAKIGAPLAFAGSYISPFGCIPFTGWARTNFELRFDDSKQTVFGQLNVETVNLDGVNPLIGGLITPIVQSTINNRVNPIEILRAEQIAPQVKLASTGGDLRASVKDVRAEVKDNALSLYVTYSFAGTAGPQR